MSMKEQKSFFSELKLEETLEKNGGYGWDNFWNGASNGSLGSVFPAKHFWDPVKLNPSGTCTR